MGLDPTEAAQSDTLHAILYLGSQKRPQAPCGARRTHSLLASFFLSCQGIALLFSLVYTSVFRGPV